MRNIKDSMMMMMIMMVKSIFGFCCFVKLMSVVEFSSNSLSVENGNQLSSLEIITRNRLKKNVIVLIPSLIAFLFIDFVIFY